MQMWPVGLSAGRPRNPSLDRRANRGGNCRADWHFGRRSAPRRALSRSPSSQDIPLKTASARDRMPPAVARAGTAKPGAYAPPSRQRSDPARREDYGWGRTGGVVKPNLVTCSSNPSKTASARAPRLRPRARRAKPGAYAPPRQSNANAAEGGLRVGVGGRYDQTGAGPTAAEGVRPTRAV